MYITEQFEKQIQYVYCVFLILFNVVCLYFIIDILCYDEILGYLVNGEIQTESPRNLAFLLFVNGISNLFFVCVSIMARFFNK